MPARRAAGFGRKRALLVGNRPGRKFIEHLHIAQCCIQAALALTLASTPCTGCFLCILQPAHHRAAAEPAGFLRQGRPLTCSCSCSSSTLILAQRSHSCVRGCASCPSRSFWPPCSMSAPVAAKRKHTQGGGQGRGEADTWRQAHAGHMKHLQHMRGTVCLGKA